MNAPHDEQEIVDTTHLGALRLAYLITAGVCGFYIFLGFLYLSMGLMFSSMLADLPSSTEQPESMRQVFAIIGGVFVVIGVIGLVLRLLAARFLRVRRARGFCFFVAVLSCIDFPYGTALGVLTFIVLSRPSVQMLFESGATVSPPTE